MSQSLSGTLRTKNATQADRQFPGWLIEAVERLEEQAMAAPQPEQPATDPPAATVAMDRLMLRESSPFQPLVAELTERAKTAEDKCRKQRANTLWEAADLAEKHGEAWRRGNA